MEIIKGLNCFQLFNAVHYIKLYFHFFDYNDNTLYINRQSKHPLENKRGFEIVINTEWSDERDNGES